MKKEHLIDYFFCAMRNMKHSIKCCNHSNLSMPQLVVLKMIHEHGQMSNNQIAKELNITNASISAMIKKLELQGYIIQQKSKTDKRVSFALISKLGLQTLEKTRELMIEGSESNFQKLTEDERKQLKSLLKKMC